MTTAIVPRCVGRYCIGPEIASGGMATIRLGQLEGPGGFRRLVAIKQLNAELAAEPGLSAILVEEARLNSAISHPNVVSIFDVLQHDGELMLVMDYVNGETLAQLLRQARKRATEVPVPIVRRIISDVLHGLHAAHTATDVEGVPLHVVHRDVSPQNIMVGVDGIARVLDFGVAKAALGTNYTSPGQVKGKLAYMAPEQVRDQALDARTDVFAAGVVLWEALSGRRLLVGTTAQVISQLLSQPIARLSEQRANVSTELDQVLEKALARAPGERFSSAQAFADALEATGQLASRPEVAAWVRGLVGQSLAMRSRLCTDLGAETVRMQLVRPPRPSLASSVRRWLDGSIRDGRRLLAATAVLAAAAAGLLLLPGTPPETTITRAELPPLRPSPAVTPASPLPALLAAGPCPGATRHAADELPAPRTLAPPPLRPESLRLETSPRVRRPRLVGQVKASRPQRAASDVLGF